MSAHLPPLFSCQECGEEVNPKAQGTWRLVTGWVENRKGGGAHAIALPSPAQGYMCNACMIVARAKPQDQTPSMF